MATRKVLFAALIALLTLTVSVFAQPLPSDPGLPARPIPVAVPAPPPPPAPALPLPETPLDGYLTRFWVSADYLLWWIKDSPLPPLVTMGSPSDPVPGALGQPGTSVLLGGDVNNGVRSGARIRGGWWLTPDQSLGLDGSFFFLGRDSASFTDSSLGVPVLARPFFNVSTGREDAAIVASPGLQSGTVTTTLASSLWGAEANLRSLLGRGPSYQLSLLGGFRYLALHESLNSGEEDYQPPQFLGSPAVWTSAFDQIHTCNSFYGGQVGADLALYRGRFVLDVLTKVALGATVERASINGQSSFSNSFGQSGSASFGQLALPTNIGWYGQDKFSVVPEVGVNLAYLIGPHLRVSIGYTFLYWSSVFRPGDQIDRAVNPTQVPAFLGTGVMTGPNRPTFLFSDTNFWAQGLNFGMEFRY